MAELTSADERRKKYKSLVGQIGEKAGGPTMYSPKYGPEPAPLTSHQKSYLKATTPVTGQIGRARPVTVADRTQVNNVGRTGQIGRGIGETGTMGKVSPSKYAQNRDFAGQTSSAPTESMLRKRIKQNMQNMGGTEVTKWGNYGTRTNSGGGSGWVWDDPQDALSKINPFAGLGLSEKRRAELRRESKFDEIMGRYGNKFGGQIASAYFGTPGMAGKELEKTVSALQARAQENIARTRGETARSVAEIGAEADAARPGTPMRYQAVSNEEGVPQVFDKVSGEFRGQEQTELSADMRSRIDKLKNKQELFDFYRSADEELKPSIRKYLGL